jgi:general secretion pathway protein A
MLPLYCEHFGLAREPFNVTPDPSFLYLSASHKEALAQLVYGIKARRGFIVLTGEVGTGKTTLIQGLLEEIKDGHTHSALIFDLIGSPKDFLRCLCQDFALISPVEKQNDIQDYLALLNRFLLECYRKGDNVALVIDEAQNLSAEVLERVRLLSNFETKQEKLLQILLVGQPELSDRLNQLELRQLKQRVALRHHLSPLNFMECREYIAKRLAISGGTVSLFSATAIEAVHSYSGGIPRLVNILCDNGLLSAYARRKERVEAVMIGEVARDLHITVSAQPAVTCRESIISKPKQTSLRDPNEKIFDLADRADVERDAPVDTGPFRPKLISHVEPPGADSKSTGNGLTHSKEFENRAAKEVKSLSDVIHHRFFQSMVRTLTEALGPMAAIILDDHIAAMGESKAAFPKRRIGQLVDEISREILNESMKGRFQQFISKELHGSNGENKL